MPNNIDPSQALPKRELLTPIVLYPTSQQSNRDKTGIGKPYCHELVLNTGGSSGVICDIRSRTGHLESPCADTLRLTCRSLPSCASARFANRTRPTSGLFAYPGDSDMTLVVNPFRIEASESRTSHLHLSAIRLESR